MKSSWGISVKNEKNLDDKIKTKKRDMSLIGLVWMLVSGVIFYLLYSGNNFLVVMAILSILAFVIDIGSARVLKAPTLVIRNFVIFAFGIVVAQVLNMIFQRWNYSIQGSDSPVMLAVFGLVHGILLGAIYLVASIVAVMFSRYFVGYEALSKNPVSSHSFHIETAEGKTVSSFEAAVHRLSKDSPTTRQRNGLTWLEFRISPNDYSVVFADADGKNSEVNIYAYRTQSDIVCEADKIETETVVSMINACLEVSRNEGNILDWRIENEPKHSDELKSVLFDELVSPQKLHMALLTEKEAFRKAREWGKKYRGEIIKLIVVAIISGVISHFLK